MLRQDLEFTWQRTAEFTIQIKLDIPRGSDFHGIGTEINDLLILQMLTADRQSHETDELCKVAFLNSNDVEQSIVNACIRGKLLKAAYRIGVGDQEQHEFVMNQLLAIGTDV